MTDKEKLEKLKKLADTMYYAAQYLTTDASRLHKAMDEYHKFIIHECKEEPVSIDFEQELYKAFGQIKDFTLGMRIAKWFYDMGKNSQEPVSEELEKAAEQDVCEVVNTCSATGIPNDHIPSWVQDAMINEFIHGANWQKEQMMAKAIEGVVHHFEKCKVASVHYNDPDGVPMAYFVSSKGLSAGDIVKMIIVKEG